MPTPLLELRNITRRFGPTLALDGATLVVHPGRVHALLGENGAGKTTLMRVAFGMIAPDEGTLLLDGAPAQLHAPADAIARGIGMVHQHFTLVPTMTVAENVALGGHGRFDAARTARAVAALAASSGLRVDPQATVEALSVPEQQRVEILKAIARDARVLILDEPSAVLAPDEADELLRWLRAYVARGHAAVLITHKLREALLVADDVTVLRHGRVAAHGPAAALTVDALTAAMLGERLDDHARAGDAHVAAPPPPPGSAAIVARLQDATAVRGRERITGASLSLRSGEITGVAGVEGSGHHLLLRLLAGRAAPDAGSVEVPAHVGFIPEDRLRDALIVEESLATNVALKGAGRRRGAMRWRAWRERAARLVARHDVRGARADDAARTAARALSGGNQQKLVLARELDGMPPLVVAEHPTRGLDVRAAAAVMQSLRDAAARGAAVVVYSPDLDEVLDVADRVLVVAGGRVRECARDRELVGRAMLGLA